MSVTAIRSEYTVDDLLELPEARNCELVKGQLVEVHVSNLSSHVGLRVGGRLDDYCCQKDLGRAFNSEAIYKCFSWLPKNARKPDASFIRKERLPRDWMDLGYFMIAPDLAVEVISPNDLAYQVDAKIAEYLKAGVGMVWEVNPQERLVFVHRVDGTVKKLQEQDILSGEDVIPGFQCRVADIFPPRTFEPQATEKA